MQLLQHQPVESELASSPDSKEAKLSHEAVFSQWYESLSNNSVELKSIFESSVIQKVKETKSPRSLIQLADLHIAKKSFRRASELYLQALNKTDNSSHVIRKLIRLYIQWGKRIEAEQFFIKLLTKSNNRKDIEGYLTFLIEGGDDVIVDNLVIFKKYAELNADSLDILNMCGLAYIKAGKFDDAFKTFNHIIKIDPTFIHGLNNMGVAYQANGKYSLAAEYFQKAIKVNKEFIFAHQNLASSYLARKDFNKALIVLKNAYTSKISIDETWRATLAQLLIDHSQDYDLAFAIHSDLLSSNPDNALYLNNQGVTYHRMGSLEKATKFYEMATRTLDRHYNKNFSMSVHGVMYGNLMEAYYNQGHFKDAEKIADKILKILPIHLNALKCKIRAYIDKHNFKMAKELSLMAFEVYPDDSELAVNISYIYSVINLDNQAALDILESIMKKYDNDHNSYLGQLVLNNYIYNLLQVGDFFRADNLISSLQDLPFTFATKAIHALRHDKPKEAKEYYSKTFKHIKDDYMLELNMLFSYFELAKYYISKRDYVAAKSEIDKASVIKSHTNMSIKIKNLLSSISDSRQVINN